MYYIYIYLLLGRFHLLQVKSIKFCTVGSFIKYVFWCFYPTDEFDVFHFLSAQYNDTIHYNNQSIHLWYNGMEYCTCTWWLSLINCRLRTFILGNNESNWQWSIFIGDAISRMLCHGSCRFPLKMLNLQCLYKTEGSHKIIKTICNTALQLCLTKIKTCFSGLRLGSLQLWLIPFGRLGCSYSAEL